MDFKEFPKMARLSRECIITEKIDGTNAQIAIVNKVTLTQPHPLVVAESDDFAMFVGSRTRWITPKDDNFGFARWAEENAHELFKLGPGQHFGEWWGKGIQRGYGLAEKRFSLFNTTRWSDPEVRPSCCHVVPELYRGLFLSDQVHDALFILGHDGSQAAPGFMKPEGVVVYHTAAGIGFKKTLEKDEVPKTLVRQQEAELLR